MSGPHTRNSFSYKAIHPNIKKILDERSLLNNTVQVGMPFVKVTTTIDLGKIRGYETNNNNYGFTLGIHAIEEDIKYRDLYTETNTGEHLIGYTYTPEGRNKPIYTIDQRSDAKSVIKLLDSGTELLSNVPSSFIPPPGITSATIGRNRNGVISIAEINFSVPTLRQLEALHRTFLIPGCGAVVEWGQQFAPKQRVSYGELGIRNDTIERNMFPWYDRDKLVELLDRISKQRYGLEEILNGYVYPTQGQYQWMYGKVSLFSVKSNSDGSYECNMKIVGPSEDSFAYSTRNTVTPPKIRRGTVSEDPCVTASNSVEEFFLKTVEGGKNFKDLLQKVESGAILPEWKEHVIHFTVKRNLFQEGYRKLQAATSRALSGNQPPSEDGFGDTEDAYFMTWRFFVNIVINDEVYGIKSIFKNAAFTQAELDKMSLLRPYVNSGQTPRDTHSGVIIDPYENFVGCNKNLRSRDPSTLIIVNEEAVKLSIDDLAKSIGRGKAEELYKEHTDSLKMLNTTFGGNGLGDFYQSTSDVNDPPKSNTGENDRGFLSTGVWVNHKAVVQCMISSDTILGGISNLLQRMNSATNNFWNLAIDPSEPDLNDTNVPFNYGIVDVNFKESSIYAQTEFLEKVHVFNKFIRTRSDDGAVFGSDVIDCTIDLSLPKLLFAQIATTGLHQPSDLAVTTGNGENLGDDINADHPKFSDANQRLREMFSITSLAPSDEFDKGPDLTQQSKAERVGLINGLVCDSEITRDVANTGGLGVGAGPSTSNQLPRGSTEDQIKFLNNQIEQLERNLNFCNSQCRQDPEFTRQIEELVFGVDPDRPVEPDLSDNRLLSQLTIGEIKERQAGRRMFAVGKYQLIPKTLAEATRILNISDSTIFSSEVQERLGDYLVLTKRPELGRYLRRESNDLFTAQLRFAQEFASMPIPEGQNVPVSGSTVAVVFPNDKISYYQGDSAGNVSKISAAEVATILQESRDGDLTKVKNLITRFESAADGYNAANVIPVERGRFYTLEVGTDRYRRAINNQPPIVGVGSTNTPTPPIVYSNRVIDINDVPRDQWPFRPDIERVRLETKFNCGDCFGYRTQLQNYGNLRAALRREQEATTTIENIQAQFPELKNIFRYIEVFPDSMVTRISNTGNDIFSNPFGAAPGTLSIAGDITLPGINGLRVGELFWIDRIPAFYKTFGAFQVISLEDIIGTEGWTTKIHARFNYLGAAWTQASSALLSGNALGESPLIPSITQEDIAREDVT